MLLTPLQIPGGPELLIFLIVVLLFIAIPPYFVYKDATERNNDHAVLWTVATVFGGLVVLVLYLIVCRD